MIRTLVAVPGGRGRPRRRPPYWVWKTGYRRFEGLDPAAAAAAATHCLAWSAVRGVLGRAWQVHAAFVRRLEREGHRELASGLRATHAELRAQGAEPVLGPAIGRTRGPAAARRARSPGPQVVR
jgi:hypothetical protein